MPSKPIYPWENNCPDVLTWEFEPVNKPVHELLETAVIKTPDRICLSFLGRDYSYAEIMSEVNKTAVGLQNLGIKKDDKVGICLPNSPYFIIAYYAAMKVGATVVNFNPLYTEAEISSQIRDSDVTTIFTIDLKAIYPKVAAALQTTSLKNVVICSLAESLSVTKKWLFKIFKSGEIATVGKPPQNIPYTQLTSCGNNPEKVSINPTQDIAIIQYTGGTTGVPKGAMLTHSNVMSNVEQVRLWLGNNDDAPTTIRSNGERFLAVLPFFHVFAMTAIMNLSIATKSRLILLPRFEIKSLLKTIDRYKPTIFPSVPSIFNAINNHPKTPKYDLTSIKYCISGGAPLPKKIKQSFEKLTGCLVVEGYGLSETSPVVSCNTPHNSWKEGCIGLPLPGTEIQIRNIEDNSQVMQPHEKGELFIKGPQVMVGYRNCDEATKETLTDGWLHSGDVGYIDKQGYIFLTDRLKEIIISNGYNVYPRIIEDVFYQHNAVEEVIVIGIYDDKKGEVPKAFVKLKNIIANNSTKPSSDDLDMANSSCPSSNSNPNPTEEELLTFVNKYLNPTERPVAIEFRDELPKTMIGKLSKKELKAEEAKKIKS